MNYGHDLEQVRSNKDASKKILFKKMVLNFCFKILFLKFCFKILY